MAQLLVVDDEVSIGVMLERALAQLGHQAVLAHHVDDALKAVSRQPFDLILSDFRMPGATGLDLLAALREQGVETPVIIMTAYSSIEHAVQAMRHGAVDYLSKPVRSEALRLAVNNALELDRLRRQNDDYRRQLDDLKGGPSIVGESRALREVMDVIQQVAPTSATVLVEGESGTGKELFARAIHERSPRARQPFVAINCAALPEGIVESTLFGHERGAFTDAKQRAVGAFERAHNGTLLQDEIWEMRLDLQAKLLRVIQEQEVERLGGTQPIKVDTRLIATTNRDLRREIAEGRFRQDLFYRLNVVPIRTPALRERPEDIPLLVRHFVAHHAARLGVRAPEIGRGVIETLQVRRWDGNIRELSNAIERAVILCRSGVLLPAAFEGGAGGAMVVPGGSGEDLSRAFGLPDAGEDDPYNLDALERLTIERALEASGGHRERAAKMLGINVRTLRNKLNVKVPAGR
jgi:DNA-binding NtrC family response regulator